MATLMLLGGSNCQLNAARAVRAMGHRLVLADYLEHPPAASLCDAHIKVSTFDVEACIQAARDARVDGVMTVGSDQPVYTAARVAQVLGLPSPISVETALRATHKRAMKEAFVRNGIPNVPYMVLWPQERPDALRSLGTPLVLKPLDSQGQRGVFRVFSPAEALARLPETLRFSREPMAMAEQYYPSDEVTLSSFVLDGRVYDLTLTDRQLIDHPTHIGVCAAHRYPSRHEVRSAEIHALAQRVADALGVTQGPLYIQFLIGAQGVMVNEAACRIGGAFEDVFIPWATGFDLLGAVIHQSLGEPFDASALQKPDPASPLCQVSVQMLFGKPGVIAAETPISEVLSWPGVLAAGYNYPVGSVLPRLENATARLGHCVLATDQGNMARMVSDLYANLRVEDAAGENLLLPRTYDGEGCAFA